MKFSIPGTGRTVLHGERMVRAEDAIRDLDVQYFWSPPVTSTRAPIINHYSLGGSMLGASMSHSLLDTPIKKMDSPDEATLGSIFTRTPLSPNQVPC